jgi:BirA family biotin operon repressor/biotin-[acetyl-CoA-carboxylase] ligase
VAAAIEAVTGLATELKHPNDVLVGGRKVAGVLAEATEGGVVLGIGINVNVALPDLPQGIDPPATSLLIETGHDVDRVELLVVLLDRLERAYDGWVAATGT